MSKGSHESTKIAATSNLFKMFKPFTPRRPLPGHSRAGGIHALSSSPGENRGPAPHNLDTFSNGMTAAVRHLDAGWSLS
jgi:hypothetical protein